MKSSLCLWLCVLLLGCEGAQQKIAAHQTWLEATKQRPPRPLEPMPELLLPEIVAFTSLPKHLFVANGQRRHMGLCVSPGQFQFPVMRSDVPLEQLSFLAVQRNDQRFSVVIWDGVQIHLVYQDTLLGRERWQLFGADEGTIALVQLDDCSRVVDTLQVRLH